MWVVPHLLGPLSGQKGERWLAWLLMRFMVSLERNGIIIPSFAVTHFVILHL